MSLDGTIGALTKFDGSYDAPTVSPDGSSVAFLGADDSKTYPQNVHVGVVPATGGEHRWLSRQLDRTFDTTAGGSALLWLDDETMLCAAEDRGETHLYKVTLDAAAPKALTSGPIVVNSFDAAGGTIAYAAGLWMRSATSSCSEMASQSD